MKIIHVFNDGEKFHTDFIEFVNKNFDKNIHFFYLVGREKEQPLAHIENVKYIDFLEVKEQSFYLELKEADKIILHAMFLINMVWLLYNNPSLLNKSYWVLWGGDLYSYRIPKTTIKGIAYEEARKKVIRNIGNILVSPSEYELVKEWYGTNANQYFVNMYLSNVYVEHKLENINETGDTFTILLGNSAIETNYHLEILERLSLYKDENIEIVCPLSYGNPEYAKKVVEVGRRIFGDKFRPLMAFMTLDEYRLILSQVDIAVFNHNRQQAFGNITTLLGMGKKVYINKSVTTWEVLKDLGIKVFDTEDELDGIFDKMREEDIKNNIEIIKKEFGIEKFKEGLEFIFNL